MRRAGWRIVCSISCLVHALIGSALQGRARALPAGVTVNECFSKFISQRSEIIYCVSVRFGEMRKVLCSSFKRDRIDTYTQNYKSFSGKNIGSSSTNSYLRAWGAVMF